jgi:hypothetical protein
MIITFISIILSIAFPSAVIYDIHRIHKENQQYSICDTIESVCTVERY